MAVADPDRFSAVTAEWGPGTEKVAVDPVVVGLALDLDLQGGMNARLVGKVAMIDPVLRAAQVHKKLIHPARHGGIGQPTMPAANFDCGAIRLPVRERQPRHDEVLSFDA